LIAFINGSFTTLITPFPTPFTIPLELELVELDDNPCNVFIYKSRSCCDNGVFVSAFMELGNVINERSVRKKVMRVIVEDMIE
jgi:hypothetical protein